jgi:predicted ferric reductase
MVLAERRGQEAGGAALAPRGHRSVVGLLWLAALGNGAAVVWLWVHGGGVSLAGGTLGGLLTSMGRLTALVGTYLVLVQVLLLARIPWLERRVGFDRLTVWHRRNGKIAVSLVVAHVPLIVTGYALTLHLSVGHEIGELFASYPGMVTATVGTALLIAVVFSSLVIARRRLPYEAWYFVHLSVYAGILLAYFHQIPTGNEFAANASQRDYWYALYVVAVALLIAFRVIAPVLHYWRYRLRVTEVRRESPDVVSIYIEGRGLKHLDVHGGQFFLWRFLSRGRWWQAHPFSLSAPPTDTRLRITVKDVGNFSGRLWELRPGTAVVAEGPFGTFTPALSSGGRVALIAGGIGITPLRAMLDELLAHGQAVTLIHRVIREEDLVLGAELAEIASSGAAAIVNVVGDHNSPAGAHLLSGEHLRKLIPDIAEREVYLCGPPAMMHHVRASLRSAGTPLRRIHSERFALAA